MSERRHLRGLTSTRFIAALFVLLSHAIGPNQRTLIDLGYLGVTFFFVLSGFVLAFSDSAQIGAPSFYRNRFARLAPLNYLTLAVASLVPLGSANGAVTGIQQLTFTSAWTTAGSHSYNDVAWSLSCEAFFYMCFPVINRLMCRLAAKAVAGVVVSGLLIEALVSLIQHQTGFAYLYTYDFPPYRLIEFIAGVGLARLVVLGVSISRVVQQRLQLSAVMVTLGVVVVDARHTIPRSVAAIPALLVAAVIIYVVATNELSGHAGWLRSPVLVRLGQWSFALYLVHLLVIREICFLLHRRVAGYLPWWAVILTVVASVSLAGVLHEFIEKPLERMLRAPRRSNTPRPPGTQIKRGSAAPTIGTARSQLLQ